jgi:hypothetical protein
MAMRWSARIRLLLASDQIPETIATIATTKAPNGMMSGL